MRAVAHPIKMITKLALVQGILVFFPISTMKFMPESDWFWRGLVVMLILVFVGELFVSFRFFEGRRRVLAVGASLGFTVLGLPILMFAAFLLSLLIGTFVLPQPG